MLYNFDVYIKSENANGKLIDFNGWKNEAIVLVKGEKRYFQYWYDVEHINYPGKYEK